MSNPAYEITERLLNALDKNYNVVDMGAICEAISVLEKISITKELLETTRLGKHINELRRRTTDSALARRAKTLVKRWRDLVIPDRSGVKSQSSSSSQSHYSHHTPSGSVDNTPHQSPLASRGYSPAVTPRLSSPQVFSQNLNYSHKQSSTSSSVSSGVKGSTLVQQFPLHQFRPQLTSPGHRNVSKYNTIPFSPGLKPLASPLVSPAISSHSRNTSPVLKNLSPGLQHKFSSSTSRSISPSDSFYRNSSPSSVGISKPSPSGTFCRNLSPNMADSDKIPSPGGVHGDGASGSKSAGGQSANKSSSKVVDPSPSLKPHSESNPKTAASKKSENYDSDSQDVIWVDDDEDVCKPVPANPLTVNEKSSEVKRSSASSSKRPRSPVNGEQHSHRESKKSKKDPRGRKPKKKRNHKSENRTVDHSLEQIPVPFLPTVSSPSTSPVLKNGIKVGSASSSASLPVIVDDTESRSPKSETVPSKQRSSRKNGCKKYSSEMDDYSAFIKNKIPAAGKKNKTTKELLEDIQSRKSVSTVVEDEKLSKIKKEDFLTSYDSKKKEMITDIIELNDSNSSCKQEDASIKQADVKAETKEKVNEPVKFETAEEILARLPPIDRSWMDEPDPSPVCTCSILYRTPEETVVNPAEVQPKKSIFEMDYEDTHNDIRKEEPVSSVSVPALPLYEYKIDPNCQASMLYGSKAVTDEQISALHNYYIPDVNGTACDESLQLGSQKKPMCKMDFWGSKPFYDCANNLFHNVVPKYKYLDYSLDRCVKNLTNIPFDKYKPAEATAGTSQWLEDLEKNSSKERKEAESKTEIFNSPADSPFSEAHQHKDESNLSTGLQNSDRVITESVNLDRDLAISNSLAFDENSCSQSGGPTNNNDPSFDEKIITNKEYKMDLDDMDSIGSESCKPWTESKMSMNNETSVQSSDCKPTVQKKPKTQLTYEDSITLLPLNLRALNEAVGFKMPRSPNDIPGDLSCIFKNKYGADSDDTYTYSRAAEPVILPSPDYLSYDGAADKLRWRGSTERVAEIDHGDDAVSDVKIESKKADNTNVNETQNSGALIPDFNSCVSNGCPQWLDKLSRKENFREWHEPVVKLSYNDEPLTILPYVVID